MQHSLSLRIPWEYSFQELLTSDKLTVSLDNHDSMLDEMSSIHAIMYQQGTHDMHAIMYQQGTHEKRYAEKRYNYHKYTED